MRQVCHSGAWRARHQRGLTLVELMVGIALSLLILTAVVYAFSGSRASYRHQESLSAVQEAGRIALETLGRDIRMAGNPGCGNLGFLEHLSDANFSNEAALAAVPGPNAGDPDGLTVVRGSAESAQVADTPSVNQIQLVDLGTLGAVVVGNPLLVSDCVFTEVMTVTAVNDNLLTLDAPSRQFRPGSQVMRLETIAYSVAGGELRRNGQGVVGGVTDLQIQYGIAGGGRSANRYLDAPTGAEIAEAVSVRLTLTVADGPEIRLPFSTTIALRNRAP